MYKKLLLNYGEGGIVSDSQQRVHLANTIDIMIGLGGTGIRCLRQLKTKLYQCVKPDRLENGIPVYERIRFIGVDADIKTEESELEMLSEQEVFSIMDEERRGTCGRRLLGRYLMRKKSENFINKVKTEIQHLGRSFDFDQIHIRISIFSGVCGGTGSGCLLDVCYMLREILKTLDIQGIASVSGYLFLPDVDFQDGPFCSINSFLNVMDMIRVSKGTPVRTLKISYKTTNLCQEMV